MANYYIRNDGSDSNNGTSATTAFKTLKKATTVMVQGDSVTFLPDVAAPTTVTNALFDPMPDYQMVAVHTENMAVGANLVNYTVPSGYTLLLRSIVFTNPTSSSAAFTFFVQRGEVNYSATQAASVNAKGQQTPQVAGFVLKPGDVFNFNATAVQGLAMSFHGYLVPDTSKLKTVAQVLSNGNNTLYTCPAGKVAYLMPLIPGLTGTTLGAPVFMLNNSGATRTVSVYLVPSGQNVGSTYIVSTKDAVNLAIYQFQLHAKLTQGDSVIMATDSGAEGQMGQVVVYEVDA